MISLRPYQHEMVAAVESSPHRRVLCEAMTGLGKTVTFSELIRRHAGRALVIVHREELADQAAATIERVTGEVVGVEMGARTCVQSLWPPRVIVASVQSLVAGRHRRLDLLAKSPPSLVIVDECHHVVASTWRRVIDRFPDARVVGVTATADRGDRVGLADVFDDVCFRFNAYDAIDAGWLVPIRASTVQVQGLSYETVRTTAGDLNGADLERVLADERVPQGFAGGLAAFCDRGHKVLAFCPSVACAERVAEICCRRSAGMAACVSGRTPPEERAAMIASFRRGTLRALLNCAVLTEGFDCPDVSAVALLGATKSRVKYVQMIGRGLRPLPGVVDALGSAEERRAAIAASGKQHLLIIDFAGQAGRHSLCSPIDVLAGRLPAEVVRRARRRIESGDEVDVASAVEDARREEEAARVRRLKVVASVRLHVRAAVDPREITTVALPAPQRWDVPASDRQRAMLERYGVDARAMTKRSAGVVIDEVIRRSRERLCSLKQEQLLRRLGCTLESLPTKDEASRMIDVALGKEA